MPNEFFLSKIRDLEARDNVISEAKLKDKPKHMDLSHLRPGKPVTDF